MPMVSLFTWRISQTEPGIDMDSVGVSTYFFELADSLMNVPAWAFSNLCIGRTYDANTNRAGVDIFPPDIPTKTENVNTFSFRYKIIKSNEDVRDLLNISGDISLKIKANVFRVEGAGKYIKNNRKDEGTTEVLAVMKCTTVSCNFSKKGAKFQTAPGVVVCITHCK